MPTREQIEDEMLKYQQMESEWRKLYNTLVDIPEVDDMDVGDFCVGWCVAKGMTVAEGCEFYNKMIPLGLY